jgi:DNA-binding transcriptional LysR family regulator
MASPADIDDLQLVVAVHETGSLGAAARRLRISQPSASDRLARLERRLGCVLFLRTTRGCSATAAGNEFARRAEHVLTHLRELADTVSAIDGRAPLRLGCAHALAEIIAPATDRLLGPDGASITVDHGPQLLEAVGEGTLAAATIAIAHQVDLPPLTRLRTIGYDPLIIFGDTAGANTHDTLRNRRVVVATYDRRGRDLRHKLNQHGGLPRSAPTVAAAVAMARAASDLAIIPRSAVPALGLNNEHVTRLPFTWHIQLSLATHRNEDPRTNDLGRSLATTLGLQPTRRPPRDAPCSA